jgi:hypothetical protein
VPDASSKKVTKIILTIVFFMFFSVVNWGSVHGQKHSRCPPPGEDKIGIFHSSEVAERLWAEWLRDTPMCQAG